MSASDNAGEAEFPFNKATVFDALLRVIPTIEGMSIHSSDELSGRIVAKGGVSLFSWGENIPISLSEPTPGRTVVRISSTAKTGVSSGGFLGDDGFFASGDLTFGKHRKNIDRIFSALSARLSKLTPIEEPKKKKCPFCAELIQQEAIKCRFCGSDLSSKSVAAQSATEKPAIDTGGDQEDQAKLSAKVVGDEIHFECSTCGQSIAVGADGVGQEVQCPECGEHLVVPPCPGVDVESFPKRVGDEIHFQCGTCAQVIAVDASAANQEFRCPECGEHLVVPAI